LIPPQVSEKKLLMSTTRMTILLQAAAFAASARANPGAGHTSQAAYSQMMPSR
jgi:hypothetical protein